MAHHSYNHSDVIRNLFRDVPQTPFDPADRFRDAKEQLGPTGEFPEGKLTPEDEGEIRIGITSLDGKVVMDFGKATTWIGFTAEQADGIADTLRKHAARCREAVKE